MSTEQSDTPGPAPTPPPAPPAGPQPALSGFFAAIRRLGIARSDDRWIGGVAGGVAQRLGIDPLVVRGALGVTMLLGFGFALYGVAWALLPEQRDGRIHLEETIRGRFDVALLGAIGMVVLGSAADDWFRWWGPFGGGWFPGLAWTAVIVAGVVVAVRAARHRGDPGHRPAPPYPYGFPGGSASMPSTDPASSATATSTTGDDRPTETFPAAAPTEPLPTTSAAAYGTYGAPATAAYPTTYPTQTYPTQPYPAQPYPTGHHGGPRPPAGPPYDGRGWSGPVPPAPPRPPRRTKRGPGAAATGTVVALSLLTLAGLMAAQRADVYEGPIAAVVLGVAVVLSGLGIMISGIRGRSSGALGAIAILSIVAAGPVTFSGDSGSWHPRWYGATHATAQDIDVATRSEADAGYSFGVGDGVIDLTGVRLTDETLTVPISVGLGDVRVIVPREIAVSAHIRSGAGTVRWNVDQPSRVIDGLAQESTLESEEMADGTTAQIALDIDLGLGDITIEEDA